MFYPVLHCRNARPSFTVKALYLCIIKTWQANIVGLKKNEKGPVEPGRSVAGQGSLGLGPDQSASQLMEMCVERGCDGIPNDILFPI